MLDLTTTIMIVFFANQQDEFSNIVQQWNAQRSEALEIALKGYLYPYLVKELTSKIISEARFSIIEVKMLVYIFCFC